MYTRSGRQYSVTPTPQQQHEVMEEVLAHLSALSTRMDVMWAHLFDKPESSGNKNKEGEEQGDEANKEKPDGEDHAGGDSGPLLRNTPFLSNRFAQRTQHRDNGSYNRMESPMFMDHGGHGDYRGDDATRRVRVDVPDFHGKLDPYAFQDWITSLEDYFDWSGLSLDRRVRFVKMKLKG
jgi:hypothetical protein